MFTRKVSMSKDSQTIQTEHHTIEIDPRDYKQIKYDCKELGISLDYYFFEFIAYEDDSDDFQ